MIRLRNVSPRVISLIVLLLACSQHPEHGHISLLDQVEDDHVAPPWEVLQMENRLDEMARGGRGLRVAGFGRGASLLQLRSESEIRIPISVGERRRLVIHVGYRKGKPLQGEAEVRLLDDDQVLSSQTTVLQGLSAEFQVTAEHPGVFWISLLHRVPIRTRLPIASLVVGATAVDSDNRATEQLMLLERWLAKASHSLPKGLPASRRLLLPMEGSTRDCVLLGEADTLVIQLPPNRTKRGLRFWHALLQSMSERNPLLQLEIRHSGTWRLTGQWHVGLSPGWSMAEVSADLIPAGSDSLRFSLAGPASLAAVSEPLLVPTGQVEDMKNLLIIDLDTVRADRLGLYGYKTRPTSTALDSIVQAKGFAVFSNAMSAAPRTEESTARFLTSKYRLGEDGKAYSTTAATLAEILRRHGYYCLAQTGGGRMLVHGLERGFHEYRWSDRFGKVEDSFPQATLWLQDPPVPFFLFLHTYEAHRPYTRTTFCGDMPRGRLVDPAEGRDFLPHSLTVQSALTREESLYVEALYDGGVEKACEATAELFAYMDTLGLWESTIVIVLSDHGEEFWDHLNVFGAHGYSLYAELLDVPFLVYSPDYAHFQLIEEAVSLVDLVPTVLDLLDLPVLLDSDGVSVVPLLGGAELQRSIPIMAQISDRFYREAVCVYEDDMKYMKTTYHMQRRNPKRVDRFPYPPPGLELYAFYKDERERHNLATKMPRLVEALADTLRSAQRRSGAPVALREGRASNAVSPDLKAQLEALGYVE